jgi:hypothetical protein
MFNQCVFSTRTSVTWKRMCYRCREYKFLIGLASILQPLNKLQLFDLKTYLTIITVNV